MVPPWERGGRAELAAQQVELLLLNVLLLFIRFLLQVSTHRITSYTRPLSCPIGEGGVGESGARRQTALKAVM